MKLFLGSIVYRSIEVPHHVSMIKLHELCYKRGIEVTDGVVRGDALVERSRSIAASAFLRSDCDVMLSVDSDIRFSAEAALAMCEKALQKDVVGGMYVTRSIRPQPALMLKDELPTLFASNAPMVEVQYLSTGFIATTKKPFQALADKLPLCHKTWGKESFWPFYVPYVVEWPDDGHILLSEDWAFCQRVKDAGFKLWLDPSIRLAHHGDYDFMLEDIIRPARKDPTPLRITRHAEGRIETEVLV